MLSNLMKSKYWSSQSIWSTIIISTRPFNVGVVGGSEGGHFGGDAKQLMKTDSCSNQSNGCIVQSYHCFNQSLHVGTCVKLAPTLWRSFCGRCAAVQWKLSIGPISPWGSRVQSNRNHWSSFSILHKTNIKCLNRFIRIFVVMNTWMGF